MTTSNKRSALDLKTAAWCTLGGDTMSKDKGKRSKKEIKTPKKVKPKVYATANSNAGKPALSIGGKKTK